MISTRGRYALRVLIDLAEEGGDGYVSMKDIAERQDLSLGYIARIMSGLTKEGLVDAKLGKGGGYRLSKAPEEYTVAQILALTDDTYAPTECAEKGGCCERSAKCRTLPIWLHAYKLLDDYFSSVTLKDLMKKNS